ncbi:DNA/RNA nuclease SfsA [Marinomonas mediterranea]|uniref:Sugar fermentation stimulation protein homolog n=1 Tax=Marinomonas mediterranea (strain ATCC 700492 / JCM 21426 / NBRC 103028 / MMB-1) TaxID=717774 RepID=F2JXY1_MARM1|nr:DNA/RNA nuclease SfsA [Marinomonas mediterranea]ADZ89630.1 Sugar fermentation stimulation protein A [Marinomonas mediterranea MMB-1]WCN15870.1 DNA/RNA nuclease SfsA [Marinomonas mediterranea MMB-1]
MKFPVSLQQGRLIKRYKRFLSDIELDSGEIITAHCPNTGSMKRCQQESARVWVSKSDNPKRKLAYTWELVEVDERFLACINTGYPNKLVGEAIKGGVIPELQNYNEIKAEVKYGQNSRVDWLLSNAESECYVEVKSVTLLEEDGQGYFPDAVTERGRKHLYELTSMVEQGKRAVLFFCVSHTGIDSVTPAAHIDEKYAQALKEAVQKGVEVIAYRVDITPEQMKVLEPVRVIV